MKKETKLWITYAKENLTAAQVLLENQLYNACLQNTQQALEKFLKALIIENKLFFSKTHHIQELVNILKDARISIPLKPEETELIDSIYLPSKYPLGSALPLYQPTEKIAKKCLAIVERIQNYIEDYL